MNNFIRKSIIVTGFILLLAAWVLVIIFLAGATGAVSG